MNYEKISEFIKIKRKEKNLTQKELAFKLGITDKAVSKWERGLGFPDVSLLEDLSNALNISILELLKGEEIKNNINKDETENFIKSTIKISKEESIRKKKEFINRILIFIIIGISLVVITLNIIQIKYLNIEYPFSIENMYSITKENMYNDLEKTRQNINTIKKQNTIYKEEDKQTIINLLENNLKEIDNNFLVNTNDKNNKIKIKDIYVMELKKQENNVFYENDIKILNIINNYSKTNLVLSYKNLYEDNSLYSAFQGANFHQESFQLSKYRLSLKKEANIAYISYQQICSLELKYQISDLLYLTEIIMEVGEINE